MVSASDSFGYARSIAQGTGLSEEDLVNALFSFSEETVDLEPSEFFSLEEDASYEYIEIESSKKADRPLKERIQVLQASSSEMEMFISGYPIEDTARKAGRCRRNLRQEAHLKITNHSLRGPLELKIVFVFPEKGNTSLHTVGGEITRLARFVLNTLHTITHSEAGQYIQIDLQKKFGVNPGTYVSVQHAETVAQLANDAWRWTVPVVLDNFLNSALLKKPQTKKECPITVTESSKEKLSAIIYKTPDQYNERYQWRERKAFGEEIHSACQKKRECIKGPLKADFEYGLPMPRRGRTHLVEYMKLGYCAIHTKQPDLLSLSQFTIHSLTNVGLSTPEQVVALRAKKCFVMDSKTSLSLQKIDEEEDLIERFHNMTM